MSHGSSDLFASELPVYRKLLEEADLKIVVYRRASPMFQLRVSNALRSMLNTASAVSIEVRPSEVLYELQWGR